MSTCEERSETNPDVEDGAIGLTRSISVFDAVTTEADSDSSVLAPVVSRSLIRGFFDVSSDAVEVVVVAAEHVCGGVAVVMLFSFLCVSGLTGADLFLDKEADSFDVCTMLAIFGVGCWLAISAALPDVSGCDVLAVVDTSFVFSVVFRVPVDSLILALGCSSTFSVLLCSVVAALLD